MSEAAEATIEEVAAEDAPAESSDEVSGAPSATEDSAPTEETATDEEVKPDADA